MSSPTKLKEDTLSTLRGTRRAMSTAKWLVSVGRQPLAVRREAAFYRLDVEQALLALGNEKLADIGAKLKENETALTEGRAALIEARKKLNRVKTVLGAIGRILDVISKVVKFPAVL